MKTILFATGLLVVGILAAGCGAGGTPAPLLTPIPTLIITNVPPPTHTPAPTPTLTPAPSPTITPTSTPSLPAWPLLQKGDWGQPEVFALQRLLRHHGFTVVADGKFGNQTLAAVREFQSSKGLTVDGLVGWQTWTALVKDVLAQEGQSGDAVRAVQHLLQFKFGYPIEVDGVFGPDSTEALKNFQSLNGLSPDGLVGPQTWQALFAIEP